MQRKHYKGIALKCVIWEQRKGKDKSITETVQNSVVYHKGAGEKLPRGPYDDYNY